MAAARYSVAKTDSGEVSVVRLHDHATETAAGICPTFGNNCFEMKVGKRDILWRPFGGAPTFAERNFFGIPLLSPWANRLSRDGFVANGRTHCFQPRSSIVRRDGQGLPIHGLISHGPAWTPTELAADEHSAWLTSRLEFWRYPELLAEFPFAHSIEVTHRLRAGTLEIHTTVENHSVEPMPVSLGYHPFFPLEDTRAESRISWSTAKRTPLGKTLLPEGPPEPIAAVTEVPVVELSEVNLLSDLHRSPEGWAEVSLTAAGWRTTVGQSAEFPVCIVYAPGDNEFLCIEPMAAGIDALNGAAGQPTAAQISPGGSWRATFCISARPVLSNASVQQ